MKLSGLEFFCIVLASAAAVAGFAGAAIQLIAVI